MMQWLQSLSQHCIRSHAPEITLTTFPRFPFCITVKHKFIHQTWKAARGLIYTRPVLRKCCLPANLENKLKVIRKQGWKYRGKVKSWCSAQYWLKQEVSNVSPLQEGWWCGVCLPQALLLAQKPPPQPEPGSIHAQGASLLLGNSGAALHPLTWAAHGTTTSLNVPFTLQHPPAKVREEQSSLCVLVLPQE